MKKAWRLVLAGFTVTVLLPATAEASCILAPPMRQAIADAPAVFVGTVIEVRYDGRWATVSILEVWKGEDLGSTVEVNSGSLNGFSSVDRIYEVGETYLFLPYERGGDVLRDNACTRTTKFTDRVAQFRPGSVTPASPTTPAPPMERPNQEGSSAWLVAGASLLGLLGLAYLVLRVTRRV